MWLQGNRLSDRNNILAAEFKTADAVRPGFEQQLCRRIQQHTSKDQTEADKVQGRLFEEGIDCGSAFHDGKTPR